MDVYAGKDWIVICNNTHSLQISQQTCRIGKWNVKVTQLDETIYPVSNNIKNNSIYYTDRVK